MPVEHYPKLPDPGASLLATTQFLNWQDPTVTQFVARVCKPGQTQLDHAVALFYAVRDQIRYDPYQIRLDDDAYRASQVLNDGFGWCVTKAVLLTACLRATGIASAIGLADVRNHLTSEKLRNKMGGVDVFYDHGYSAAWINERWFKLVPAFNIELCERFDVQPTEFDGTDDALYQQYDARARLHMQYLTDHGTYSDLPLQKIRDDFARYYPANLMAGDAQKNPNGADPFNA